MQETGKMWGKELTIQQGWGGGEQESTDGERDRPVLFEQALGAKLSLGLKYSRRPPTCGGFGAEC